MRVFAAAPLRSPIAAIRSPLTPTSPRNHGAPVPSTMRPPAMIRSNGPGLDCGDRAAAATERAATSPAQASQAGRRARVKAMPECYTKPGLRPAVIP